MIGNMVIYPTSTFKAARGSNAKIPRAITMFCTSPATRDGVNVVDLVNPMLNFQFWRVSILVYIFNHLYTTPFSISGDIMNGFTPTQSITVSP